MGPGAVVVDRIRVQAPTSPGNDVVFFTSTTCVNSCHESRHAAPSRAPERLEGAVLRAPNVLETAVCSSPVLMRKLDAREWVAA